MFCDFLWFFNNSDFNLSVSGGLNIFFTNFKRIFKEQTDKL